jgi:hypothetical protein
LSRCGTGATGVTAIGVAHDTGTAGTTTAQDFTSTSGRDATITAIGAITTAIGAITTGGIGVADKCRRVDCVVPCFRLRSSGAQPPIRVLVISRLQPTLVRVADRLNRCALARPGAARKFERVHHKQREQYGVNHVVAVPASLPVATLQWRARPGELVEELSNMRSIGLTSLAGAVLLLVGTAQAQTTPQTTPQSPPPAAAKPDPAKTTLTEEQAKSWIDKPVFSSDGKELGEVADFKRAADNAVVEMHIDIGGLLGMGETRVSVTPVQFKLQDDRVVLSLTEAQAKALPKVKN